MLLAIDLAGVVLILILATVLTVSTRRSRRELQDSLSATQATNEALEAAVAERTEHLVAAHDELRLSAAVLRSTFHSMAEAVLVIDTKGEILLSNPAAEKMLRYRPGMTVEQLRSLSTAFHADGVTPLPVQDMPASRALRGEAFDAKEIVVHPVSGKPPVHLMISGRPLRDAAGAISGAALVYHDATASRETEHKLLQSQKLDAIGKLTGGVAHDFNNMLTVITGTTETLVAGLAHQPALQKTAELIDQAAERCSELIQHLLAFARRQPLQPRNVDVNATVLDIAKLLRPTLGEQIEVNSILEQETATAHIDASQLANSLLNMAINARDAMPNGGKLLLETRNVVLDEAYAQANPDAKPGPYVMLAVSDTGAGMSQDVLDKVFEPFFTTKEVGKGSGLGLSMVYGFVKQSGGHIRIYSEVGHGTTIKLYLPPARGQVEAAPAAASSLPLGNETIMVVEDDALVRNFVTAQLQSLGYRTVARRQRTGGAEPDRRRRGVRSAVHRRHHARRHVRPRAGGEGVETPARHQGALHIRLYRQCDRASGPPRPRRAAADQAVSEVPARQHDPPRADGLSRHKAQASPHVQRRFECRVGVWRRRNLGCKGFL